MIEEHNHMYMYVVILIFTRPFTTISIFNITQAPSLKLQKEVDQDSASEGVCEFRKNLIYSRMLCPYERDVVCGWRGKLQAAGTQK